MASMKIALMLYDSGNLFQLLKMGSRLKCGKQFLSRLKNHKRLGDKMKVNKEQEDLYKKTMEAAKKELEDMDSQMEQELQKIREKLAQMQESKKYYRQIYEGAAHLLGIEVETDGNGDGDALGEGGKASPLLQIQKNKS
jgi:ElaB/YqjD/DUF883 family membrane-anchored ribosome-binding protein